MQIQACPAGCAPVCAHYGSSWPTPECCPPAGWGGYHPDNPPNLEGRDTLSEFQRMHTLKKVSQLITRSASTFGV